MDHQCWLQLWVTVVSFFFFTKKGTKSWHSSSASHIPSSTIPPASQPPPQCPNPPNPLTCKELTQLALQLCVLWRVCRMSRVQLLLQVVEHIYGPRQLMHVQGFIVGLNTGNRWYTSYLQAKLIVTITVCWPYIYPPHHTHTHKMTYLHTQSTSSGLLSTK